MARGEKRSLHEEIARLRAEPPGAERDLRLAELLFERFDLAAQWQTADVPEPADLDEVLRHLARLIPEFDRGGEEWLNAVELRVRAHELLFHVLGEPRGLDLAIEDQRDLVRCSEGVDPLLRLVDLLVERYVSSSTTDADLHEAAALLRLPSEGELSGPDRAEVDFRLGFYRVRLLYPSSQEGTLTVPETTEVLDLLARTFRLADLDDGRRSDVLLDMARVHELRSRMDGVDREAEREEAVVLFRGLEETDIRAALGLAMVLVERHLVRADPVARDEAIEQFRRLDGAPDLDVAQAGRDAILGGLLLERAKENPHEVEDLVSYLEEVYRDASPVDGALGALLLEALCLRPLATAATSRRVVVLVDELAAAQPTDVPHHAPLPAVKAVARAAWSLRTMASDDLDAAEEELRVASRGRRPYDWPHLLLVSLLGALAVVRHGGTASRWPNPLPLAGEFPPESRAEMLGLLEEHRGATPDVLCAVALLRADGTRTFRGGSVAEHERYRRRTIGLLEEARAALPPDDDLDLVLWYHLAVQCSELGRLLESAPETDRGVALFEDLLDRMGESHPAYSVTTLFYGMALVPARLHSGSARNFQYARAVLTRAARDPALDLATLALFQQTLGMVEYAVWMEDSTAGDITAAVNLLQRSLSTTPAEEPRHDDIRHNLACLLIDRFKAFRELHDLDAAAEHLASVLRAVRARGDRAVADESLVVETIDQLKWERSVLGLSGADQDATPLLAALKARLAELDRRVAAGEHVDGHALAAMRGSVAVALLRQAHADSDPVALDESALLFRSAKAMVRRGTAMWANFATGASGASATANTLRADRTAFEADVRVLAEVWGDQDLPDAVRERAAGTAVAVWRGWYVRTKDVAALDAALALIDDVVAFGGEEFERGYTTVLLDPLADDCWERGDVDRAVRLGFRSLRVRARDVLLQTAGDHGLQQAKDAASRALVVADWCSSSGLSARAVEAVEWGRGLVLAATTATADVTALLREGGHDSLAEEWTRSVLAPVRGIVVPVDFAPDDVRRRVLGALSGRTGHRPVLAPPSASVIANALLRSDSDVLVHLLPGRALLVTSHQDTEEVPLPLLREDDCSGLALEESCGWAWRVAMGPLLDRLRELGVGDGLPRVVLVPSGELGAVPWHAARAGERVAVREAVFSYAASGRQFCDLAARPRPPVTQSPVVVNDPIGDLPGVLLDTELLHARLPHGRFYGVELDGVPHSGDGTPEEVLEVLPGASLLHLGCHAQSGLTLARSFLRLTSPLSVDRVLDQARGRAVDAPGGLVVLAACQSDLSGADHDEALTLASAFVAAGAASVFGTKWEVHDIGASILICVFYTELLGRNPRPRDALRATQLWALDPDRIVPEGMPLFLASRARRLDLAHPSFWAAFTHQGW